jgi:dTDP-4-amino-4,6-dideoxygalactose transaminase
MQESGFEFFIMNNRIYLSLAHMSEQGSEQKYVKEAFDTNWVVPLGPNVTAFEELLKSYLGGEKEVVALSAGTAAIHLGLVLLGVKPGDEVICQSFTFCASANPITYLGATPVFVDSESDTWNISPVLLEKAIEDRIAKTGKKPKAIIAVHLYGMPAKMDEIVAVAGKYQIPILEDAAEALGSRYKGACCGTLGEVAALSFNGNKMITTSGGGTLICSTDAAKKEAVFYATQARESYPYYQHEKIGYNYRMSNVCAGIGRGQMEVLEDHVAHHKHVHQLYQKAFEPIDGVFVQDNPDEDFDSNFWLSTILIDENKTGVNYETLRVALDKKNIETRPLWKPLHLQPVFSSAPAYVDGTSERLFQQGLCLPSGPCVTDEDVQYVVDSIMECLSVSYM